MKRLTKKGFNYQDVISSGNMFLLGNGRFGYRGTLEEFRKEEMTGLNMLGVYDRYLDKWRESVNLPNPFYVNIKGHSLLKDSFKEHEISLDIEHALFNRKTSFDDISINSTRFVCCCYKDLLGMRYVIKANKDIDLEITLGLDLDIFDINGPHFKDKKCERNDNVIHFKGVTNENKNLQTFSKYLINKGEVKEYFKDDIFGYLVNVSLRKDEELVIEILSQVEDDYLFGTNKCFDEFLNDHKAAFKELWKNAYVEIDGDEDAQFELLYSIYHLLILEDNRSTSSVPARGLSGQTYKGAIFWDTEMFMLPFYALTNPTFARNTIIYRIRTIEGAKKKAKKYGFDGAFYAWESQEDGIEQCSDYNVSDPITNKPIRTYFADKQIHISGDIALAISRYIDATDDYQILSEGGYEVIYESIKFYLSYMKKDVKYHLNDVLGPDEYHERVNDNAYTNLLVKNVLELGVKFYDEYIKTVKEASISKDDMVDAMRHLYIQEPNKDGIIEQFTGYYDLEDVLPNEVKARKKNDKEYMGGENGVASRTRVIKQADVLAELILLNHDYDNEILRKNYEYYYPYTEHGSSLSASVYSIAASKIDKLDDAYYLFRKSSGIDLGTDQKMYAGGIYIGGTHPASNAGAYLSIVLGFAGLTFDEGKIKLDPHLPKSIKGIRFKLFYRKKQYEIKVHENNTYEIKEAMIND